LKRPISNETPAHLTPRGEISPREFIN